MFWESAFIIFFESDGISKLHVNTPNYTIWWFILLFWELLQVQYESLSISCYQVFDHFQFNEMDTDLDVIKYTV